MTNGNSDDLTKKVLSGLKPDAAMVVESMKKANDTIAMLINQLKVAEASRTEMFIILGTVLNKYGRKVVLADEDMIALDPVNYVVTAELVDDTGERIIRLKHVASV